LSEKVAYLEINLSGAIEMTFGDNCKTKAGVSFAHIYNERQKDTLTKKKASLLPLG